MPTTSPKYPTGTATAISGGGSWTNLTSGLNADDGMLLSITVATKNSDQVAESGAITFTTGEIPTGATINTVTLEWEDQTSVVNGAQIVTPYLGATAGTAVSHASSTTLTARSQDITAARPGGGSWTAADFHGGTLTVRVTADQPNNTTSTDYRWDYVRVVVGYSVPGTTPYRTEVLADSPLAYLRLGEASGTTAADEQATHAGTYVNTPTLGATGAVAGDTAATFDRTASERVDWTTLGTFGQSLLTASFEFWVKTSDTTNQAAVFGAFNTGTTLAAQVLLNSNNSGGASSGSTYFYLRTNDGLQFQASIATNIYDGAWHHVVWVVESNTTYSVYVDGASQTVTYNLTQWGATPSLANFGFALALAARNLRGTPDLYAATSLDEVAFYTSRLTSTRVQAHYDARTVSSGGVSLTSATETDAAQSVTAAKQVALTATTDTGSAVALGWSITRTLTPGTEAGSAQAVGVEERATLTNASGTDTALALSLQFVKTLTPAVEAGAAQAVTTQKHAVVTAAVESDAAQALTNATVVALLPAAETDAAQGASVAGPQTVTLTAATEADTAVGASFTKAVALGTAAGTDAALVVTASKRATLAPAVEVGTAQQISTSGISSVSLTPATEVDAGMALTAQKPTAVAAATETDGALALSVARRVTVTPVVESGSAQALVLTAYRTLSAAVEADAAQAVVVGKVAGLDAAVEVGDTPSLLVAVFRDLSAPGESDSALALSVSGAASLLTLTPATAVEVATGLAWAPVPQWVDSGSSAGVVVETLQGRTASDSKPSVSIVGDAGQTPSGVVD